jgi:hypothetical protein
MNDTSESIFQKQLEILESKSMHERWVMAFDLTELSRYLISRAIKRENPGISEVDAKVELFRRFYSDDFHEEELNVISKQMRKFLIENT